ncbi:hypothetical protein JCM10213v2_000192 [Rhodosporidiobolus nylandii]
MSYDPEKQRQHNATGASMENGYPLAPTKSRNSQHGLKHTLSNKPDDVSERIWLEESSVTGIKERKVLGYAGAVLTTVIIGSSTFYSSHILWRFCAAHPEVRDIADAAQVLCGGRRSVWYIAFTGLALNNYFIMGLHCVAGATAVQTIRGGTESTIVWAVIIGVISESLVLRSTFAQLLTFSPLVYIPSNVRDFSSFTPLGLIASSTMFVAALIVMIGHGTQGNPSGWTEGLQITHSVWAPEGTTFVQGMNAVLNIVYTFIGHALIPSFIGDMEHPEDFPKALGVSMTAQMLLYTILGAVVYHYTGTELTTAPAYGSLHATVGRVAAGFVLPTIIIVGILYSLVTSRAIFFQIFREDSVHRNSHTLTGWATWLAIVFGGWVISFIIGEAIPFFNDMLSLIACLFDSWFGYMMWTGAWFSLNRGRLTKGPRQIAELILSVAIGITGIFFFTAGTYASVQSIIDSYAAGAVKTPFTTANTGFVLDP